MLILKGVVVYSIQYEISPKFQSSIYIFFHVIPPAFYKSHLARSITNTERMKGVSALT